MISPHLLMIDASYSYRTYGGCLEGAPSVAVMMTAAKNRAEELWGKRASLVIDPTIKGKMLPPWTHMIWAHGPEKDPDNHGSELVIIWWSEMQPDTDRVLQAVDWEKHASDFQY
jgi:hypothetical protein